MSLFSFPAIQKSLHFDNQHVLAPREGHRLQGQGHAYNIPANIQIHYIGLRLQWKSKETCPLLVLNKRVI